MKAIVIFHANLNYAYLTPERYNNTSKGFVFLARFCRTRWHPVLQSHAPLVRYEFVIRNSYELILDIFRKQFSDIRFVFEASGYTIEQIAQKTPDVLEKLKQSIRTGQCEFMGSPYAHSTWLYPGNNGYLGLQAGLFSLESTDKNIQFVDRPPAAVLVKEGHHIQFIGNQFQHLGATALDLCHAVSDNLVESNTFEDIAGIGIALARFNDGQAEIHSIYKPDDAREICQRNIIRNNFIQFAGQDYADACGIAIGYARETLVEHNEIADLPYTGISIGWGWSRDENVMRDNTIQYNEIHHVVKLLADGGGIYTLSRQPNSLIKANYIHDIRQSPWVVGHESGGIFMDEGSGGITLENNVFVNVEKKIKLQKVHGISILGYDLSGSELETVKATAGLEPKFQNLRGGKK